jgi:ubiquinone/menaquinone biosynthesis C-methylase UbiE
MTRNLERLTELWHGEGPNLNAGCGHAGTCIVPPFINFDLVKRNGWDTKPHCIFALGDVRKLPYSDNYFDVIFASELIEHFMWDEVWIVLREFYRTLKSGGCLKVCTRNFEWIIKLYLGQVQYKDYDMSGGLLCKKDGVIEGRMGPMWQTLYGHQQILTEMANIGHQTIWDEELLKWALEKMGFINIERVHDKLPWTYPYASEADLCVEAWK